MSPSNCKFLKNSVLLLLFERDSSLSVTRRVHPHFHAAPSPARSWPVKKEQRAVAKCQSECEKNVCMRAGLLCDHHGQCLAFSSVCFLKKKVNHVIKSARSAKSGKQQSSSSQPRAIAWLIERPNRANLTFQSVFLVHEFHVSSLYCLVAALGRAGLVFVSIFVGLFL